MKISELQRILRLIKKTEGDVQVKVENILPDKDFIDFPITKVYIGYDKDGHSYACMVFEKKEINI